MTKDGCPSDGAINTESPMSELVMMANPRCENKIDPRYYVEILGDHKNNCEFDIFSIVTILAAVFSPMKPSTE